MMRLRVMLLPSTTDEETPFMFVLDNAPAEIVLRKDALMEFAREAGARTIIVSSEPIELPED